MKEHTLDILHRRAIKYGTRSLLGGGHRICGTADHQDRPQAAVRSWTAPGWRSR